jgi:hypothetical protein
VPAVSDLLPRSAIHLYRYRIADEADESVNDVLCL